LEQEREDHGAAVLKACSSEACQTLSFKKSLQYLV